MSTLSWVVGAFAFGVMVGYRAHSFKRRPKWYKAGSMWP